MMIPNVIAALCSVTWLCCVELYAFAAGTAEIDPSTLTETFFFELKELHRSVLLAELFVLDIW